MLRTKRSRRLVTIVALAFLLGLGANFLDAQTTPYQSRTHLPYLYLASWAHIASGAGIEFGNYDATITHSANTLTLAGGTLVLPALKLTTAPTAGFVWTSDAAGLGTWTAGGGSSGGWTAGAGVISPTTPTDNVSIATLIQASDAAHYFGGVTTAGSWRIVRENNDLVFDRYESAAWVTKFRITAVIP